VEISLRPRRISRVILVALFRRRTNIIIISLIVVLLLSLVLLEVVLEMALPSTELLSSQDWD
jgi:hypothetical protein